MKHILMVASENDGLKGGKVGGVGDVIRDVPPALVWQGCTVDVITPAYGFLHHLPGARPISTVDYAFRGKQVSARIHDVPGKEAVSGVRHLVVAHSDFTAFDDEKGQYRIYVNDPPQAPFASDASKYAHFCTAVAEALMAGVLKKPDCLHLHDWHSAFFLILRKFDALYQGLARYRTAYTIHNLSLQGIRPLEGHHSSLAAWFPGLACDPALLNDPRWPHCLNPMAVGIRFADKVHTVSPSYAGEITLPSQKPCYYGGEGLEADLRAAREQGRLFGILNGCAYPPERPALSLNFPELLQNLEREVNGWLSKQSKPSRAHRLALARLSEFRDRFGGSGPAMLLTSVSRIVEQKMLLLKSQGPDGNSALQNILQELERQKALYILMGTGERVYEDFLASLSSQFSSFLFLNGYSDPCAALLYALGDLFLMPSSFEPCGISQMLAMREGQPCLVHAVGGLKDTVSDGLNGFAFSGGTMAEQVAGLIGKCREALSMKHNRPDAWQELRQNARAARFPWERTIKAYLEHLY